MKIGKLMRNGQVLCSGSKPTHTMRWRLSSPAMMSGVCGDSTSVMPHGGGFTARLSATCTLSKFTKRSSGCALFQSTMGGAFAVSQPANQFVLAV